MRIFFLQLVLIAVPFVLYRIYAAYVIRRKIESDDKFNEVPLSILFLAGVILAGLSFVFVGLTQESKLGDYTPPRLEDGKIIPPKTEPGND